MLKPLNQNIFLLVYHGISPFTEAYRFGFRRVSYQAFERVYQVQLRLP